MLPYGIQGASVISHSFSSLLPLYPPPTILTPNHEDPTNFLEFLHNRILISHILISLLINPLSLHPLLKLPLTTLILSIRGIFCMHQGSQEKKKNIQIDNLWSIKFIRNWFLQLWNLASPESAGWASNSEAQGEVRFEFSGYQEGRS